MKKNFNDVNLKRTPTFFLFFFLSVSLHLSPSLSISIFYLKKKVFPDPKLLKGFF